MRKGLPQTKTQLSVPAMEIYHLLTLALVQGATEFLPVSSSGHLNLIHALTPLPDAGVGMDVALHSGTLIAVMVYFRRDVRALILGAVDILAQRRERHDSARRDTTLYLFIASVPVLLVGAVLMASGFIDALRTAYVVAWANLIFAVPLWLADRYGARLKSITDMSLHPAVLIGCAQVLALIPGASRAGVTMTAARALGFSRPEAARFSMLLSIPVIAAFALASLIGLIYQGDDTALMAAATGAALSALVALASIHIFMKMTQVMSLTPFVLYRLALGIGLLLVL